LIRRIGAPRRAFRDALRGAALCLAAWAVPPAAFSARAPIVIDGNFDDWAGIPPACADGARDGILPLDFGRLWLADDDAYLYLRFETGGELLLNSGNQLAVHLDTDDDPMTGDPVHGLGAELSWRPGRKGGSFYAGGDPAPVDWADLGFVALPAVTATGFECAFRRDARPDGARPLFPGPTVRVLLQDDRAGGDLLPDAGSAVVHVFDLGPPLPPAAPPSLRRDRPADLRTVTWNVHDDGLFRPELQPKFRRMLRALAPDVVHFQEIYHHSAADTEALLESWLSGTDWHAAAHHDCQTLSRFPILGWWAVDGNLATLLDTAPAFGASALSINVHLPCCADDAGRRREVDHILAFLRDAKAPGGEATVPAGSALLICGDTNFVGDAAQPASLLSGDVADEGVWGSDFGPDWDGRPLVDLISQQAGRRVAWTWRSSSGDFWPGRLDYIIYNRSAVRPGAHFVLDPAALPADTLAALGLLTGDGAASDHLPHCADLRPSAADTTDEEPAAALRWTLGPNPSPGPLTLALELPRAARVSAGIFDLAGRKVGDPLAGTHTAGPGTVRVVWDGRTPGEPALPSGVYYVRVVVAEEESRRSESRRGFGEGDAATSGPLRPPERAEVRVRTWTVVR